MKGILNKHILLALVWMIFFLQQNIILKLYKDNISLLKMIIKIINSWEL
jgi:hypothetical protein